jgi:hypothetical protein
VAGRARLIPWLALGVLLAHGFALEWVADHLQPMTALRKMPDPLFTRVVTPQAAATPPVEARAVPPARPRERRARLPAPPVAAASAPAPAASAPEVVAAKEPFVIGPDLPASAAPGPGPGPEGAAAQPAAAASAGVAAASAAASAPAAGADALASWPTDTRLSYRLGGHFRSGELYGDARVQWQRADTSYQVRVDIDITLWVSLVMTSQGEVSPNGLVPRAYEELRRGKRRAVQLGDTQVALDNGRTAPRPAGVQDTASQFVELSHRFATGQEKLEVGRTVSFWMARPGAVDYWTYDIVERELLQTPNLGVIEAWRLKPRPIANPRGNITAEMWFAPSLQYLPVRIRVSMGNEAHVDLLVDRIEQR